MTLTPVTHPKDKQIYLYWPDSQTRPVMVEYVDHPGGGYVREADWPFELLAFEHEPGALYEEPKWGRAPVQFDNPREYSGDLFSAQIEADIEVYHRFIMGETMSIKLIDGMGYMTPISGGSESWGDQEPPETGTEGTRGGV